MSDGEKAIGRPRSPDAGPALMAAARRLVGEHGYEAVTIGMIAADAGVSRQTLYRRWPSKAELILDAFLERAAEGEDFADGPLADVLEAFLINAFKGLREDAPAIRNLIASAQSDPAFLKSFRERFVEPRAAIAAGIIQQAIDKGEIDGTIDVDMTTRVLHGAFWYEMLLGRELDEAFARRLVILLARTW